MKITLNPPINVRKKENDETNQLFSVSLSLSHACKCNNQNPPNVSFHGASKVLGDVEEAIERYGKEIGEGAKKYLNDRIKQAGLVIENDSIEFKYDGMGKRLVDMALYPVLKLPLDMANSALNTLKKIPFLKDSKEIDKLLESKLLKGRKIERQNESTRIVMEDYLKRFRKRDVRAGELPDDIEKHNEDLNKDLFKDLHKRMKLGACNYSMAAERGLTRLVSGVIPAYFLAKDAYNLSIYMNNDKKSAKEAKQRRFKQEIARIAITAAATFGILKLFSKKSNQSGDATTVIIAIVTMISEIIGRKIAGNPVLPLSKEQAEKYAQKRNEKETNSNNKIKTNTASKKQKTKEKKKAMLTLENALKAVGILVVLGFGVDKISKIKPVKELLSKAKDFYEGLYKKEFQVTQKELNDYCDKLREINLNGEAAKNSKNS